MNCYITHTGSFLPNLPIPNSELPLYLGELDEEADVRRKILRMNGIKSRHYALNKDQTPTHDVYQLAALAAEKCIADDDPGITYLSAGSTNTPYIGPGISSVLHSELSRRGILKRNLEINSNSGICSASAQALVNTILAVHCGDHGSGLCVGVEQPSAILKSSFIVPPDDRKLFPPGSPKSKWFMSVFLRSMLSDGAGAAVVSAKPSPHQISYKVNWTYSRSFADEAPLCMTLEARTQLLSQDVGVLAEHMAPSVRKLVEGALESKGDKIGNYQMILPHLSSFYFKRYMMSVLEEFSDGREVAHWTNLETVGNTGAASIFVMLDEFTRTRPPQHGEKVMLFIPESGQFNFVLISLTAVHPN
ncbi:hypothetical protein ACFSSA_13790 [Luteolibacter algae]|uniref:Beta-ketoacyl-[acyl-carrier-protein] synthase III C-terminal domain-containing protein n=1 Tax=Luteolibacter algae TaxID=454151 RepID=A0ABW5DB72_9BACT